MHMKREVLLLVAAMSLAQACGGRSVDLNQRAPGTTATTPAVPPNEAEPIVLPQEIGYLWVDESRFYWQTASPYELQGCLKDDCEHSVVTYVQGAVDVPIATAAGHVYWRSGSTIYSCPSAGCDGGPQRVVQDPTGAYSELSADGDYVYWSSIEDIYRCRYSGCGPTPEVVAAQRYAAFKLSFQGSDAYWVDGSQASSVSPILRAPSDGSAPPSPVVQTSARELGNDGVNLYWTADNTSIDAGRETQLFDILSCPLDGCGGGEPAEVATGIQAEEFLVDSAGLYWIENKDTSPTSTEQFLHSCPLAGCGSSSKVIVSGNILSFAVDDQFLYWVSSDNAQAVHDGSKRIHRAPK
jgi:hypothetical protein